MRNLWRPGTQGNFTTATDCGLCVMSAKFLHPVRHFLNALASSSSSHSHSSQCVDGKIRALKRLLNSLHHPLYQRSSIFERYVNLQRKCSYNIYVSGKKFSSKRVVCASVVFGSIGMSPFVAWAMDGVDHDALVDDPDEGLMELADREQHPHYLWELARKLLLPAFFFLTVLRNLDHPVTLLFTEVTVFLLIRKPGPFSVYIIVDQLCRQFMCEEPHLHKVKPPYATKVEVEDYKLLCLANVIIRDQKFTLVGVLGDWWTLPLLPSKEVFSSVKTRLGSIFRTREQDPLSGPSSPLHPLPSASSTPNEKKDQMPDDEELVMFRDLIKVSPERASVLEEACTRYPHLWEWHKNNRPRFCEWGYESLSDLLLFLKTHAPKDLNEESLSKFECLCMELEKFQFDNGWISSVRKRVMESIVDEEVVKRQENLMMQEAALLRKLDDVRAELNIVEQKISGYDVPFDI